MIDRVDVMHAKWYDRTSAFLLGMIFGAMLICLVTKLLAPPVPEAVQKLHDAVHGYMNAVDAGQFTLGASQK